MRRFPSPTRVASIARGQPECGAEKLFWLFEIGNLVGGHSLVSKLTIVGKNSNWGQKAVDDVGFAGGLDGASGRVVWEGAGRSSKKSLY